MSVRSRRGFSISLDRPGPGGETRRLLDFVGPTYHRRPIGGRDVALHGDALSRSPARSAPCPGISPDGTATPRRKMLGSSPPHSALVIAAGSDSGWRRPATLGEPPGEKRAPFRRPSGGRPVPRRRGCREPITTACPCPPGAMRIAAPTSISHARSVTRPNLPVDRCLGECAGR